MVEVFKELGRLRKTYFSVTYTKGGKVSSKIFHNHDQAIQFKQKNQAWLFKVMVFQFGTIRFKKGKS